MYADARLARVAVFLMLVTIALATRADAVRAAAPHWLVSHARAKTVALRLIAGWQGVNGGLNFDGYSNGHLRVTVPLNWKVAVTYSNQNAAPHSVIFVRYRRPIPVLGFTPAFPHAQSAGPMNGSDMSSRPQTFSFIASRAGTYMIVCGVPGHASSGMWDLFVVSTGAHTATWQVIR